MQVDRLTDLACLSAGGRDKVLGDVRVQDVCRL